MEEIIVVNGLVNRVENIKGKLQLKEDYLQMINEHIEKYQKRFAFK